MLHGKGSNMPIIILIVVLSLLRYFEIGPVANLSWWWIAGLFLVAFLWFEFIERILGLENVHVIHANDSKGPLGSHVDRHQHVGQGYIGLDGFRRILTHPQLRSKAFILETPVDQDGDEQRNLDTLKGLCRKASTTTTSTTTTRSN